MKTLSFVTPNTPELHYPQVEEAVRFSIASDYYQGQVRELNIALSASRKVKAIGTKAFVAYGLLLSLVKIDRFQDVESSYRLNEFHVDAWINYKSRCN